MRLCKALLLPWMGLGLVAFCRIDWTLKELELVASRPQDSFHAFVAQLHAKRTAERAFGSNEEGDQSDAVRHYMWAGLMVKELGAEKAKLFLSAHETQDHESTDSRRMDLQNNEAGVRAAERLKKRGALTRESLELQALKDLLARKLTINEYRSGPYDYENVGQGGRLRGS